MTTPTAASPAALEGDSVRRTVLLIGLATAIGSMSFDFWYPFMPLYLLKIGASSEANALFWIAVATAFQGTCRFLTGPLWGVLSDRVGRKVMLLRALYLAVPTILIAAFVQAPWQITIALTFQGLFSGFVPAAVALTSVSVPESKLGSSLSIVTGCQYLGTTFGPSIGAVLAALLGYRGAILIAAILPAIAATGVLVFVPRDRVGESRPAPGAAREKLPPFRPTRQFLLIVFAYFIVFAMSQLIRLAAPIAIKRLDDHNVNDIVGLAFTLGGFASAISVLVLAPRFFQPGRNRAALIAAALIAGLAYIFLSQTRTVPLFVVGFVMVSLLQAAMIPATNTLIAANVPRARRGTGFGWAGSAQALAFIAGPAGAAIFGAISLDIGFFVLGGILLTLAVLLYFTLVDPTRPSVVSVDT